MELIQVGKNTYYLDNPTNIGIYLVNDKDVYLIDSGNSKDTGKKILKILNEHNWNVVGIINTHSHADHIGGNNVIQNRTNCKIFNSNIENSFVNNPILEPSLIYGGYPFKDLLNRTLLAKESNSTLLNNSSINLFDVIELKSAKLDFDGTHITGIQLGYDSPFPTTDESYFTTCITASGEEWDTWYTDSELTRIDTNYFDESEIPKLTNQWLYINFDVDGGG